MCMYIFGLYITEEEMIELYAIFQESCDKGIKTSPKRRDRQFPETYFKIRKRPLQAECIPYPYSAKNHRKPHGTHRCQETRHRSRGKEDTPCVSMRSGRPICAPRRHSGVSPMLPLKQFQCWVWLTMARLWWLLCPPVYLLCHFLWHRHVQDSSPTGCFEGGCRTLTHASLVFPFHFSLFVAGSLDMWERWHVWSDCHISRQIKLPSSFNSGRNERRGSTWQRKASLGFWVDQPWTA